MKTDQAVEVTETQYKHLMNEWNGCVAGRKAEGKYYIKCMINKYLPYIKNYLIKK